MSGSWLRLLFTVLLAGSSVQFANTQLPPGWGSHATQRGPRANQLVGSVTRSWQQPVTVSINPPMPVPTVVQPLPPRRPAPTTFYLPNGTDGGLVAGSTNFGQPLGNGASSNGNSGAGSSSNFGTSVGSSVNGAPSSSSSSSSINLGMLQGPDAASGEGLVTTVRRGNQPNAASRPHAPQRPAAGPSSSFGSFGSSSSTGLSNAGPPLSEVVTQAPGTTVKVIQSRGAYNPATGQQPQVTIISIVPPGQQQGQNWGGSGTPMAQQYRYMQPHQQQLQQPAATEVVVMPAVEELQPGDLGTPASSFGTKMPLGGTALDPDVLGPPVAAKAPPQQPTAMVGGPTNGQAQWSKIQQQQLLLQQQQQQLLLQQQQQQLLQQQPDYLRSGTVGDRAVPSTVAAPLQAPANTKSQSGSVGSNKQLTRHKHPPMMNPIGTRQTGLLQPADGAAPAAGGAGGLQDMSPDKTDVVEFRQPPSDQDDEQPLSASDASEEPVPGLSDAAAGQTAAGPGNKQQDSKKKGTQGTSAFASKPCGCPAFYFDFMCGSNGITYANLCTAQCAGVAVAYAGPCEAFGPVFNGSNPPTWNSGSGNKQGKPKHNKQKKKSKGDGGTGGSNEGKKGGSKNIVSPDISFPGAGSSSDGSSGIPAGSGDGAPASGSTGSSPGTGTGSKPTRSSSSSSSSGSGSSRATPVPPTVGLAPAGDYEYYYDDGRPPVPAPKRGFNAPVPAAAPLPPVMIGQPPSLPVPVPIPAAPLPPLPAPQPPQAPEPFDSTAGDIDIDEEPPAPPPVPPVQPPAPASLPPVFGPEPIPEDEPQLPVPPPTPITLTLPAPPKDTKGVPPASPIPRTPVRVPPPAPAPQQSPQEQVPQVLTRNGPLQGPDAEETATDAEEDDSQVVYSDPEPLQPGFSTKPQMPQTLPGLGVQSPGQPQQQSALPALSGMLSVHVQGPKPWVLQQSGATDTILIGCILPFEGDLQLAGKAVYHALKLAIAEEAPKLLPDVNVNLTCVNTRCADIPSHMAMTRFVQERAVAVVGELCSAATVAAAGVSANSKLPLISPAATSPALSGADFFFRTVPSDKFQGQAAANLLLQKGYRNVAMVYEDAAYGYGLAFNFIADFTKEVGNVPVVIMFKKHQGKPKQAVLQIKADIPAKNLDAVFLSTNNLTFAAAFMKAAVANDLGLKVFGGDALADPMMVTLLKDAPAALKDLSVTTVNKGKNPFIKRFKAANPGVAYGSFAAQGYDAMVALLRAYAAAPPPRDGPALVQELQQQQFEGVSGPIAFDKNGDVLPHNRTYMWVKHNAMTGVPVVKGYISQT